VIPRGKVVALPRRIVSFIGRPIRNWHAVSLKNPPYLRGPLQNDVRMLAWGGLMPLGEGVTHKS
jgi:hypothetical protein